MADLAGPYPGQGSKPYRAYVLGALAAIYTLNFVDRILLGIVQEPLKHDLGIDDFQLGLLGGPAFAIFYTLMGIPIARVAERANRISIIAIGAAVWSVMTAACGLAANFAQLALARIGVGFGEAACSPPAHSVIADYFPGARRASALSIYSLGIPLGTMLAALCGGWLVSHVGWREAFWLLGLPGLAAALALKLTVREPARAEAKTTGASFTETLALIARKPTFWHASLAAAIMAFVGYPLAQFLVSFMVRTHGLDLAQASYAFAAIAGLASGAGTFLGGAISDRLGARRPRALMWPPALGAAIALPLLLAALAQDAFWPAFVLLLLATTFQYAYLGPTFSAIQSIAPPNMRATAAALLLLIINLIGYGLGPPTAGALSNYFANAQLHGVGLTLAACTAGADVALCAPAQAQGLKLALMCVVCALAWPALQFWLAGRTLARDRVS